MPEDFTDPPDSDSGSEAEVESPFGRRRDAGQKVDKSCAKTFMVEFENEIEWDFVPIDQS